MNSNGGRFNGNSQQRERIVVNAVPGEVDTRYECFIRAIEECNSMKPGIEFRGFRLQYGNCQRSLDASDVAERDS